MPHLSRYLSGYGVIPPFHILRELIARGRDEAGMSGGCEWRPFELSAEEYREVVEELLTSPRFHCTPEPELDACPDWTAWTSAVRTKYQDAIRPPRNSQ